MSDAWTDLAGLFKERNNSQVPLVSTGTVLATNPFKVQIQNGVFQLTRENTDVCRGAIRKKHGITSQGTLNSGSYTAKGELEWVDRTLEVGDSVLVLADISGQHFYIVDVLERDIL